VHAQKHRQDFFGIPLDALRASPQHGYRLMVCRMDMYARHWAQHHREAHTIDTSPALHRCLTHFHFHSSLHTLCVPHGHASSWRFSSFFSPACTPVLCRHHHMADSSAQAPSAAHGQGELSRQLAPLHVRLLDLCPSKLADDAGPGCDAKVAQGHWVKHGLVVEDQGLERAFGLGSGSRRRMDSSWPCQGHGSMDR